MAGWTQAHATRADALSKLRAGMGGADTEFRAGRVERDLVQWQPLIDWLQK